MKITWIGQAGLLVQTQTLTMLIDPYLSDSVGESNPKMHRRIPVDQALFALSPDVILCTHDHADHCDLQTLEHWLKGDRKTDVLGPRSVWERLRAYGGPHNYILFQPGTSWSFPGLRVTAVKAEHSDPCAIGVILDDGEKVVYVTGDTLYNSQIFASLPDKIDQVILPVNGVGNNMNFADAARFARACRAAVAIPVHWGLMDTVDPNQWTYEPKYIPTIFQEIRL